MASKLITHSALSLTILLTALGATARAAVLEIDNPMPPPAWALAQRALLKANAEAAFVQADKYIDERGWMRITPNWGAADGPDDVMESYRHLPLLYVLGGPPKILDLYKKIWEGHLQQFTAAKEPLVEVAKDGMYYKEFIPSLDWEHTGEGMAPWYWYGLARPDDPQYLIRARRFAGLYMNEDPEAPNYDPQRKIIRSLFNGSRGPLLTPATEYHWGGNPRPRHDPRPGQPPRTERWTRMGYTVNLSGDHPQNLMATNLAMTAYLLTGEAKYRDWILEYADAWVERAKQNGGNIPTNIGLDGTIGGERDGKWWGGVYGWDFRPKSEDGSDNPAQNMVMRGVQIGFGIALMLTADYKYPDTMRKQIDNLHAQKKLVDGKLKMPHKYGDNGWYAYLAKRERPDGNVNFWFLPESTDIYLWEMKDEDLSRVDDEPWIRYLQGEDPDYPQSALRQDHEKIRRVVDQIRKDEKTEDTRSSGGMPDPLAVTSLLNLMLGASYPGGGGNVLHARVRYFDPAGQRPGLPPDVAALVEQITAKGITLTLVNTNPVNARELIVQTGAYAEHECVSVTAGGRQVEIGDSQFTVRLAPGSGERFSIRIQRFANQPTFTFPWNR
jgi:hypothetical protein